MTEVWSPRPLTPVKAGLIRAVVILCGIVLVGCSRQGGKESFEFLKAQHEILENTKLELKKHSNPKPPSAPVFSRQTPLRQRLEATKAYHDALDRFLSAVIQNSEESERLLNDAQTRISALNPARIHPDAAVLAKLYEKSLGDKVQVYVEMKALATIEQNELRQNKQHELITPLIIGILDAVVTDNPAVGAGEFLKGVSQNMKKDIERQQAEQSHFMHLQEVVAAFERDSSQTITKRSELITSFGVKYPGYPWNSLLPATAQSSTNNPERP